MVAAANRGGVSVRGGRGVEKVNSENLGSCQHAESIETLLRAGSSTEGRCEDSVANSEAVVCRPHRISLRAPGSVAAVVTHHIVGLWGGFGLKNCRQRGAVDMVWR